MITDKLDNAAVKFAKCAYLDDCKNPTEQMIQKYASCYVGFIFGAQWQRNNIWHNIDEPPTQGEFILVRWTNRHSAAIWRVIGDDIRAMKMNDVVAWAYIKDILPIPFDEILDENKDVLQRLKDK